MTNLLRFEMSLAAGVHLFDTTVITKVPIPINHIVHKGDIVETIVADHAAQEIPVLGIGL